ncbi:primosomal protein N' [Thiomonas intermedia]|uniref:primosomal protein N' n=1 Tax=Thiomonas intermedia TaxID=926 RepID=UPI0009A54CF9|nr:primosomal protein N' [Thiomonas intermedia]
MCLVLQVAVDAPGLQLLDYRAEAPLAPGTLVRVPLGRQTVSGVVMTCSPLDDAARSIALRPIEAVFDALPPLDDQWRELLQFVARYYQRAPGEVIGAALPAQLRNRKPADLAAAPPPQDLVYQCTEHGLSALPGTLASRSVALWRLAQALGVHGPEASPAPSAPPALALSEARGLHPQARQVLSGWAQAGWVEVVDSAPADGLTPAPELHPEQAQALQAIAARDGFAPFLLFGVTGSGKTEVYLHAAAQVLQREPGAQVLILTPEINLTPQLVGRFEQRFGAARLAVLHSGLSEGQRLRHWLAAHTGQARIVLGTRLAALASMPALRLIVVDEEHDASYKQQEGARYSARDLALWRGQQLGIAVVLGSATPSLESWRAAQTGRYALLTLTQRATGVLPSVRLADTRRDATLRTSGALIGQTLDAALRQRLERGEQSLLFLNRRGYAPVLSCPDCGWMSDCPHCDAHLVFHRTDRTLRCHHCGYQAAVPRACPGCGSLDLQPVGKGTQRVEEALAEKYPQARIARIDADSTRRKGAAASRFDSVHAGEVDILVGTQMVTKGHDFQRVTLVAALNPDAGLFTHDPRGPERLFAQLMQAAGRAGRAVSAPGGADASKPEMLVQTAHPEHPLYRALVAHDYPGFAQAELIERERGGMPPFTYQALLRAEHRQIDAIVDFLALAQQLAAPLAHALGVTLYPPIPAALARVADMHRMQMLLEGPHRGALQNLLTSWRSALAAQRSRVRWAVDVDPLDF